MKTIPATNWLSDELINFDSTYRHGPSACPTRISEDVVIPGSIKIRHGEPPKWAIDARGAEPFFGKSTNPCLSRNPVRSGDPPPHL
jgi:hypothetical protein